MIEKSYSLSDMESALVMFSGGQDSTLTAVIIAEKVQRLLLVTYAFPWTTIGINNSCRNVPAIARCFPKCDVRHMIVDCRSTRRRIWENQICNDYWRYCSNTAPGHICLGCKMAMMVESIRIAKQEGISQIANGMSGMQSDHPECMPSIVNRFTQFMNEYGISYRNSVYLFDRDHEEHLLSESGINTGLYFGQANITQQARCLLGFYSTVWKAAEPLRQDDMISYFESKIDTMRSILSEYGYSPVHTSIQHAMADKSDIMDEKREYTYNYEFSKVVDRTAALLMMPVWWFSRLMFRSGAR